MPTYHVTLPNGKTYEVVSDAPLSESDAFAHAQSQAPKGPSDAAPVSSNEPDTWWGGFTKGILGDKPLMTTAGITAAGLAAPVTGGSSLLTIPAMMAAGGAAGAAGANVVRRHTDSREQAPVLSDASEGAVEGAISGLTGPAMKALGRASGYVGEKLGPWGRHIVSGAIGFGSRNIGAGIATEAALNPDFGPRALQAVGEAAEIPTVRRTIGEIAERGREAFRPSMQALEESHSVRNAGNRRAYGIRQATEKPYRAGSGASDPYVAAEPRAPMTSPPPGDYTTRGAGIEGGRMTMPSPDEPIYSDVRGQLDDVAGLDDELALTREMIAKGFKPDTARRIVSPAMRSLSTPR